MTLENVNFRGSSVSSDWPKRLELAQRIKIVSVGSIAHNRIRFGEEKEDWGADTGPCRDCLAIRGEFHAPDCDIERCPVCGGQLWFGCECSSEGAEISIESNSANPNIESSE